MKRKQFKSIAETEPSYAIKRYNLREFLSETKRYISTERSVPFSSQSARSLDSINICLRCYAEILAIAFRCASSSPSFISTRTKSTARFLIDGVNISADDANKIMKLSENSGFSVEFHDGGIILTTEIKIGIPNVINAKSKRIVYNTLAFAFSSQNI